MEIICTTCEARSSTARPPALAPPRLRTTPTLKLSSTSSSSCSVLFFFYVKSSVVFCYKMSHLLKVKKKQSNVLNCRGISFFFFFHFSSFRTIGKYFPWLDFLIKYTIVQSRRVPKTPPIIEARNMGTGAVVFRSFGLPGTDCGSGYPLICH